MADMTWAQRQAALRAQSLDQRIPLLEQMVTDAIPVREPEEQLVNDELRGGLQKALDDALARQAQYQSVLDAKNADINADPAGYLKTIARQGKKSERALIRLIRIVGELNSSADTGSD